MARDYFKIVCLKEREMAAAGLGYEAIYGHEPRYFWSRPAANARAAELNNEPDADLSGTYTVQRRQEGMDADDDYCAVQLNESAQA